MELVRHTHTQRASDSVNVQRLIDTSDTKEVGWISSVRETCMYGAVATSDDLPVAFLMHHRLRRDRGRKLPRVGGM